MFDHETGIGPDPVLDIHQPLTLSGEAKVEFLKALAALLHSHSQLASAEYQRNPRYNSSHFSHKAEEQMLKVLPEVIGIDAITLMQEYQDAH